MREESDKRNDNQRRESKRQHDPACGDFFRRPGFGYRIEEHRKNDWTKYGKLDCQKLKRRERMQSNPFIRLSSTSDIPERREVMVLNPDQVWCDNDGGNCKR
jgi:hypothetical protein